MRQIPIIVAFLIFILGLFLLFYLRKPKLPSDEDVKYSTASKFMVSCVTVILCLYVGVGLECALNTKYNIAKFLLGFDSMFPIYAQVFGGQAQSLFKL